MSKVIDLDLTTYAARVAAALREIEKDLSTDYHVQRVPIYIVGEDTGCALVANDADGYDLSIDGDDA